MSEDDQRLEVITGTARRRRWPAEQKLRIILKGRDWRSSSDAFDRETIAYSMRQHLTSLGACPRTK